LRQRRRSARQARRRHGRDSRQAAQLAGGGQMKDASSRTAFGFVAPALAVIFAFFVVPVVAAVALSFTDFDIYAIADLHNLRFIALDNYRHLLADPLFWKALRNTAYFALVGGPLSILVSLAAALLVDARATRWKGVFRTVLFLPVTTTLV